MDLELRFDGLQDDLTDAVLDVLVDDIAMADAAADGPTATLPALSVSPGRPTVRVSVDLPADLPGSRPGLLVRVRGRTARDERIEFFNMTATPAGTASGGPVPVVLTRIA